MQKLNNLACPKCKGEIFVTNNGVLVCGNCGQCYQIETKSEKKQNTAAKELSLVEQEKVLAEDGDIESQFNLGQRFFKGFEVKKNYAEAVKWWEKAGNNGHGRAMFNVGYCYSQGIGVKQDHKAAIQWYEKAANAGVGDAQYNLACIYYNGENVPSN